MEFSIQEIPTLFFKQLFFIIYEAERIYIQNVFKEKERISPK